MYDCSCVLNTIPVGQTQSKDASISQYPDINVRGEVCVKW